MSLNHKIGIPLSSPRYWDSLLKATSGSRVVLVGDGSHGTEEFYHQRIEITKKLIQESKFNFVAIEGNFSDLYKINKFVHGKCNQDLDQLMNEFDTFPIWVWKNHQFRNFITWLRGWNDAHDDSKVGIYGMDLYSMYKAMRSIIEYLEKVDPSQAEHARQIYEFFEQFHGSPQEYGYAVTHGYARSRQEEIKKLVKNLLENENKYVDAMGLLNGDEWFFAKQNAELLQNAEGYYRNLYSFDENTWNLRDHFFFKTVCDIMDHHKLHRGISSPKCVVWAHNSHCGDARATAASNRGQWNIGQLFRQNFKTECFNIGCLTYRGSVTAANDWDTDEVFMKLKNGIKGSIETQLHEMITGSPDYFICFRDVMDKKEIKPFFEKRIERYVGVIYRPKTELSSHYSKSYLTEEFDAIVFLDQTHALVPISPSKTWQSTKEEFDVNDPDQYPEVESRVEIQWIAEKLNQIGKEFLNLDKISLAEQKFTKALSYTLEKNLRAEILCNRAIGNMKRSKLKEAMNDCYLSLELSKNDKPMNILKAIHELKTRERTQ